MGKGGYDLERGYEDILRAESVPVKPEPPKERNPIFILSVKENTEVFSFCDEFDKKVFTK